MKHKLTTGWTMLALAAILFSMPVLSQQQESPEAGGEAQPAEQAGQRGQAPEDRGPNIYPNLAADLIELGVPVIDVRSAGEIEQTSLLADATHIVHTDIDAIADFIGEDKNRAVVLYCGSGRRVSMVVEQLRERGYGGLVNAGGHSDLQQAIEAEQE